MMAPPVDLPDIEMEMEPAPQVSSSSGRSSAGQRIERGRGTFCPGDELRSLCATVRASLWDTRTLLVMAYLLPILKLHI